MTALVLELQQAAMNPKYSVADLLRMALVVTTKLDLGEFGQFIESELNGYKNKKIPEYRRTRAELKAWNPYNGWIPVVFNEPQMATALSNVATAQSIGELEALLDRGDSEATLQCPFTPAQLNAFSKMDGNSLALGIVPTRLIPRSAICGIVNTVRNLILKWSLQLEKDGILGEGLTFSPDEKRVAASIPYRVQNFYGPVNAVAGGDVRPT